VDAQQVLPQRVRLFHVGPPKTGTTALQWSAAQRRTELLEAGVRYPGRLRNHRLAVAAFLDRPIGWVEADGDRVGAPAMRHWYQLLGEVEAEPWRRVWFGHEYAAQAGPDAVARFAEQLGPDLHVVITLRSFARMLPSMWQEHLKGAGARGTFERWLRGMLLPERPVEHARVARHDHAALVERWADRVGPDRVTVIAVNRRDPGLLFRSFEGLLDLPAGLLESVPAVRANRSLTLAEIELLRRLNRLTRTHGLAWSTHERLVVRGAVDRVLASSPGSGRLELPAWAVPLANREAERVAEAIAASGVRVVGDLADVAEPAAVPEQYRDHRRVEGVPMDVAVESLAGMLAAAAGYEPDLTRTPEKVARQFVVHLRDDLSVAREVGWRRLAGAAAGRARSGLVGLGYAGLGWRRSLS